MNPIDPKPLDYRSPFNAPASPAIFSLAGFFCGLIIVVTIALLLFLVTPRFEQIFKDFGMKLPLITELLLATSRLAVRWWRVVISVLVVVPVAMGFLAALVPPPPPPPTEPDGPPRRRRRGATLLVRGTILVLVAIVAVTTVALLLPMISLIQAVRGK